MSVLLAALLLVLTACGDGEGGDRGGGQEAASVNGEEIASQEVDSRFQSLADNPQISQQLQADEGGAMEAQLRAELLTQMVQVELMEQGADDLGVEVDDDDIEDQRAQIEQQLEAQGMDLETAMEQQGLDEEQLQEELRAAALQEAIVAELSGDDEVTDEEVADYFEENSAQFETAEARHILVESQEEAEDVIERLEGGEDFAEVAQDVSIDEQSAEQGGELGELTAADLQMAPALQEAIFEEGEPGEIVGPVEGEQGWHVIEVLDATEPELADVEDEIRAELDAGEDFEVLDQWLGEQSAEADIEVAADYGEWDAESGQVVPDIEEGELPAPGQAPEGQAPEGQAPEGEELDEEDIEELEEQLEEQMDEQDGDDG